MRKNNKDIKYLVISDIHLGHNINKADNIIENLQTFFKKNASDIESCDIIFIAGDVFDRLLINSGHDYIVSVMWITDLIKYCQKHNIVLRILEGTPSHDWQQAKLISSIIDNLKIEVDYKYISTVLVEHMEKFNLNILYVPDEIKHKASDVYKEVKKELQRVGVAKVDIAIMHGQFHFQMEGITLESSHNEVDYLNIVDRYINIGHIHTHSVSDRILAQGSFDRLTHGQEEPKGAMLMTLSPNGDSYRFIENDKAMIFKTYKFKDESLDDILKFLNKELKKLDKYANIRLVSLKDEYVSKCVKALRDKHPKMNITVMKTTKEAKFKIIDEKIKLEAFAITPDNIQELLGKEIAKYNFNKEEQEVYVKELNKVV